MFTPEAAVAAAHTDPLTAILAALSPVTIAALGYLNHRKGKTRDTGRAGEFAQLSKVIAANHADTTEKFNTVSIELRDIRAFVVGPDGENGLRGDVREIKAEVKGLLERERDHLSDPRQVGTYDRRSVG